MDKIELNNGQSITCKALNKQEYDALMQQATGNAIDRFKERYNIEVHILKSGEVTVKEGSYYTLYLNLDDLDKVLLDASGGGSQGQEVMLNKNPFGKDFPKATDVLVNDLLNRLNIDGTSVDNALIPTIEQEIEKLPNAGAFKKEHFISFIAVLGNVLQKRHNVQWDMELASDGITWNPFMKIENERIQFFVYLYEDLFINDTQDVKFLSGILITTEHIIKYNLKK